MADGDGGVFSYQILEELPTWNKTYMDSSKVRKGFYLSTANVKVHNFYAVHIRSRSSVLYISSPNNHFSNTDIYMMRLF